MRRSFVALGTAGLLAACLMLATRSGSGRAYLDLATSNPKYFVVTGPHSAHLLDLPPFVRRLEQRGVKIIGAGCVSDPEQDAYNAVIVRHYDVHPPSK